MRLLIRDRRAWLVNFERGYSITIDSEPLQ